MKRYMVEVRTTGQHRVCDRQYFETEDDAIDWVNDERFEDFKYGESDDYEYKIIDLNEKGGNEQ